MPAVGLTTLTRAAVNGVHYLDHFVGRLRGPAHVLVDVRTPMNLSVLRPVWKHLAADPRVRLSFTAEDVDGIRRLLGEEGLADALVPHEAAAWQRFDLVMTADAWNHSTLRRCRRRINFFHGVAGKYDLDDPHKLAGAGLERVDRMAFINADRLERYVASGVIAREQAVLVGFPKVDDLLNGTWPAAGVRSSLGLAPDVETVLYAPTFSPASSLHLAGEQIITTLLDSGRNVIVKLHDRSAVPHEKYTEGLDWPARLAVFDSHPRYARAREAEAGPYLSAADVLVTDHSTVGFEVALLDRPIVVYDAPALKEAARIDEGKWNLLRSMADVVSSPEALRTAVDAAFAAPERLRPARARAQDLFAYAGAATPRALAAVYELLELPMLRMGSAHAPCTAATGGLDSCSRL